MSRSPYIDDVVLTEKHSGKRKHKVQAFVIHHMAAKWTGKRCAEYFRDTPSRQASANYCIGYDGDVALNVEEGNRAWTSSSEWADQRAITYELANSKIGHPWEVSDVTINKLIVMLAEQHKRYGLDKATYTGDTTGTLWRHDWFVNTNCPGPYLGSKFEYIAQEVNKILSMEKPIVAGAQVVAKKPVPTKPTVKPAPVVKQNLTTSIEKKYAETGVFHPDRTLAVYDKPSTSGNKLATYYKGESVKYHTVHIGNGHVWIEYERSGGGSGYIPIRTYVNGVYGSLLGIIKDEVTATEPVSKIERKYAEVGVFYPDRTIKVYDQPFEHGNHVATYYKGENVTYHHVQLGNGYVWLEYRRSNGQQAYIPCRTYSNGKYGPLWGTIK